MAPDARTTPLVGRDDELGELSELLGVDGVLSGSGTVLLAGDAGVGKTRILHALRDRAVTAGRRDLVGHCLDFGDSALPYLPFTEILGRLLLESPEVVTPLVTAHPSINRLLPGQRVLASTAPHLTEDADEGGRGTRAADVQTSRADLFESVHTILEELARETPLLVVIEDTHWADQSTRELLSFLFSRRFEGEVSLVVSYRSDDVHRRHPLRAAIAEWTRLPGVRRVQLAPLADVHVRTLVQALHPTPLHEQDVDAIIDRAEGNAFFAEELVNATQMHGARLPDDLADLLLVRLDRLDDASRSVVRAAAVAGRRVSHELLARVIDSGPVDLDLALRQAVESHVLVPARSDSYAFRHALLAEAIYDDLLPGERVRLHASYVRALRSGAVVGTAAELARHARAAQDLPTAIGASVEAGDDAMHVGAPEEAARHYELALELISRVHLGGTGGDAPSGADLDGLVLSTADALIAAGHPYRAVSILKAHLAALPADTPPTDRARLLVGLASASFVTDGELDPLEVTGEAMSLVPAEPATPLRAKVLNVHAKATTHRMGGSEANRFALDALAMAEALGLPGVAAEAAMTLAKIDSMAGDPDGARSRLERVVKQARADEDVSAELRALHQLGGMLYYRGEFAEALVSYEAAAARAAETGQPWAPYGLDARALAGLTAYTLGDWDQAVRAVDVAGQSPPAVAEALLASIKLAVLAGRGASEGLDLLDATRAWWHREGMVAVGAGSAGIDLLGDRHDIAGVLTLHDETVTALKKLWKASRIWAQIRLSALVLGQLASTASRTATGALADLGASGERFVTAAEEMWGDSDRTDPARLEARVWMSRVTAEHLRLRWLTGVAAPSEEELVAGWRTNVADFVEMGHVFEVARSQARLAEVLRATGQAEEARSLVDGARLVARRLGAEPLLAQLRGGGSSGATGEERAARQAARTAGPVLTAREHEILGLVAQGRTNAEIGRRLFISAKTVSVHVSNVMAKLGAGGRTEAVAIARREGILLSG